MKFLSYKELKEIETKNPQSTQNALLKAFIIAVSITSVIIVLQSSFQNNSVIVGLLIGFITFFSVYSTSMYEINLLEKIGKSEKDADAEINGTKSNE